MKNKKILLKLISVFLVVCLLGIGAIPVLAYDSIYTIKASDWTITNSSVLGFVYDGSAVGNQNDAYYCSVESDDLTVIKDVVININANDFTYSDFYFFKAGTTFYIVNYDSNNFYIAVDSSGHLFFYCYNALDYDKKPVKRYLHTYKMTYPYDRWIYSSFSFGNPDFFNDCDYPVYKLVQYYTAANLYPFYCTSDVLYTPDSVALRPGYRDADEPIKDKFIYTYKLEKSLQVYSGYTTFLLQGDDINRFKYGTYAFSFNDVGCETLGDTYFAAVDYELYIIPVNATDVSSVVESNELLNAPLIGDGFDSVTVPADSLILNDYIVYWQNNYLSVDTSGTYAVGIVWNFASELGCKFFPGTINIIEYESYESDLEHDEVMNAIDEASATISGSIDNAASDLGQEITQAAIDIQSSINQSTTQIVTSVDNVSDSIDNASSAITDKLSDVQEEVVDELNNVASSVDDASDKLSDKLGEVQDGITNKLTEVKDNLLDGIKSFFIPSDEVMEEIDNKWDELLKSRFGALYEVSGIITDFASQMSWDYVKQAGEKKTITMPSVTVNLVGTDFTFGGYEVSVIPEGFDVLTTALKGITSIVCTLLFVNALRRKYDKLVGGNAV